jgi:hypothetical protein|tara:strand:- start:22585 stop:24651 length:2067 start_codon:yes stop_codon:yes gene_type:complete
MNKKRKKRGCFECGGHYESGGYVPFMPDPQFLEGGVATPLPGGATEFTGRTHKEGGIMVDDRTEVEDGETMDKVKGQDYFFSNYLKLGGKSFSQRHKQILAAGGDQKQIDELADIQEAVAGRDKYDLGGEKNYQSGGRYIKWPSDYRYPESEFWYYQNSDGSTIKFDNEEDYLKHAATTGDSLEPLGDQTYSSYMQMGNDFYSIMQSTDPPLEDPVQPVIGDEAGPVLTEGNSPNNDSNETNVSDPTGYLYDGTTDADWEEYREEAEIITGIDNFNFRNPQHIESLQTVLLDPGADLDPTYFSGQESDYITGDLGIHQAGIDGKGGADTLAALRQKSEEMREEVPVEDDGGGMQIESDLYNQGTIVDPYAFVEGEEEGTEGEFYTEGPVQCPCDPSLMEGTPECEAACEAGMEDAPPPPPENKQGDNENAPSYNTPGKRFPWDTVLGVGAAAAQLLPAYMAFKEKPDYMGAPGRLSTVHLDRVAFNDAFAANAANYRGMSRFIEQSGLGPGGISNRMAAWRAKQMGDEKVESTEARANTGIANQEAVLNQQGRLHNIKNRMYVDEFNRAADSKTKDRKLMAVQNAVHTLAGMNRDRMMYKAEMKKASAVDGGTGVNTRFNQEWDFRKANPNLQPGTQPYRDAYDDYQLSLVDPDAYAQNQLLTQNPQNTYEKTGGYRKRLKRKKQIYG